MESDTGLIEGFYFDCSKHPLNNSTLFALLDVMHSGGVRYCFINFGEHFPWADNFHFRTPGFYSEEMVSRLSEKAHSMNIELVPVLPVLEENDFIIKDKSYRGFAPGFPDTLRLDYEAAGLNQLYEDMIEDIFSVFGSSVSICLKFPKIDKEVIINLVHKLLYAVSLKDKKVIFQGISPKEIRKTDSCLFLEDTCLASKDKCLRENQYSLTLSDNRKIGIIEVNSVFELLSKDHYSAIISSYFFTAQKVTRVEDYDCTVMKNFNKLKEECWREYSKVSENLAMVFLNNNSSVLITLLKNIKKAELNYSRLILAASDCIAFFTETYVDEYIHEYFQAKTEPLEELLEIAKDKIKRIKRRLS